MIAAQADKSVKISDASSEVIKAVDESIKISDPSSEVIKAVEELVSFLLFV